jgi:RNA binding exosome subunit
MPKEEQFTKKTSRLSRLFCKRRNPLPSPRNQEENLKVEFTPIDSSDMFLSSQVPIAYVDIRVFAHATEELEKVLTAVHNTLPTESVDTVTFRKTALTGHHGNPITLFETRIKNRKVAQAFLEKLASGLSVVDKETLGSEIVQHLENGNLYIRLDKQSAYRGELKLSSTDTIHLRIHFRKPSAEEVIGACRRFGLLP